MKLDDFDFNLPLNLIAQTPLTERPKSRLMVLNRQAETISHDHFFNLKSYLKPGDVLVRNNTRVIPARLFGVKAITNAHVELLILRLDGDIAECLVGNARTIKVGTIVTFNDNELKAECLEVQDEGIRVFKFIYQGIFLEVLQRIGNIPLPPYIKEKLEDKERYQTVYAKIEGSAAAPTAGLHFNEQIFKELKEIGVEVIDVTLHVGLGTFKPVSEEDILSHKLHSEYYVIDQQSADRLNRAKEEKRRIIAIGTTSTRVLESVMKKHRKFVSCSGQTDIFIYPGIPFLAIDGLITNFHLPKSTLIMLVSAFANTEFILKAYQEAIENEYRFFSFGDSMFIY